MPNTNRDVYADRLESDRKIRRHAAMVISDLMVMDLPAALALLEEVRSLIKVRDGVPLRTPITPDAAAIYSRIPIDCTASGLRAVHLLEVWVRYIEEGIIDFQEASQLCVYVGAPLNEAEHIRLSNEHDMSDVIVSPDPGVWRRSANDV